MRILTVLAVVLAASAAQAGEGFLCREDTATAFREQGQGWKAATEASEGTYHVVPSNRPDTVWEVTLEDHDMTVLCTEGFNEGGWVRCDGLFTFVLRDNKRFMAIHDVPYTLERMGQRPAEEYTPFIATGTCTPR